MNILPILLMITCSTILAAYAQDDCPTDQKVMFCYYSSWAIYRYDIGAFSYEDIDASLCTHLVYAFSGLSEYGGIQSLDTNSDFTRGGYAGFAALKNQNPCLKTLLAIGGWNEGSRKYSVMVSNERYREAFVDSVIRFLVEYDFDGLDIDWEYPTARGGIAEDKENFGKLLQLMKETLQKWNMLLTIAVPITTDLVQSAYDMNAINSYVDYVLIMGYDYTATDSPVTGLISPLTEIDKSIQLWREVLPTTKIVLGVPAYGRSFTLKSTTDNGLGAETSGPGAAGYYTQESGFLSYLEVMSKVLSRVYTVVPVPNEQNYYAYYEDDWIVFEMYDNYVAKTQYVLENDLGGVMVWSLDTDDFLGELNATYAIINTIRDTLYN